MPAFLWQTKLGHYQAQVMECRGTGLNHYFFAPKRVAIIGAYRASPTFRGWFSRTWTDAWNVETAFKQSSFTHFIEQVEAFDVSIWRM